MLKTLVLLQGLGTSPESFPEDEAAPAQMGQSKKRVNYATENHSSQLIKPSADSLPIYFTVRDGSSSHLI